MRLETVLNKVIVKNTGTDIIITFAKIFVLIKTIFGTGKVNN
jgi:hypothetical protein